jgi:signal recognition particle receptor subunit beta
MKKRTTVALDFGLVRVNGTPVRLFGTPGQARFDFMWEALSVGMDGYIVLVDSSHPRAAKDSQPVLRAFRKLGKRRKVPYVVVITKTDQPLSRPLEKLVAELNLPKRVPVLTCNARSKRSVMSTLKEVLRYLGYPGEGADQA